MLMIRGESAPKSPHKGSSLTRFPKEWEHLRCWGAYTRVKVDGGWTIEQRGPQECTYEWVCQEVEGQENLYIGAKLPAGYGAIGLKKVSSLDAGGDTGLVPWAEKLDNLVWKTHYVDRGAPPFDWMVIGRAPANMAYRSSEHVEILLPDTFIPLAGGYYSDSKEEKQPTIDAPLDEVLRLAVAQIDRESTSRPLVAATAAELLATSRETCWLIYRTLEAGVMALLIGRRGSFKSFAALHWSMAAARDGFPVLMISAEGIGLRNRMEAWLRHHAPGVDPATLPILAIERRVDLTSLGDRAAIRAAIAAWGKTPALIVVDTWSKCVGALNLDNNAAVSRLLGELNDELRQPYGATLLIVCHTGHGDQNRARGAASLEADTEAAYVVRRKGVEHQFTVSRQRFKDYGELPALRYTAHVFDLGRKDDAGNPVTSLALEQLPDNDEHLEIEFATTAKPRQATVGGRVQRQLLDTLAELTKANGEVLSGVEVFRTMRSKGVQRQSIHTALKALERDGVIERSATGDDITIKGKLT